MNGPHPRRLPRWATVLLWVVVGGALGWVGGRLWFAAFGGQEFGSDLEGLQEIVRGVGAGGLWGGLAGWLVPGVRPRIRQVWLFVGSAAAAVLCVTGLSYIGDLTNQGPAEWQAYLGFAALPAGAAFVYLMARASRQARRDAQSNSEGSPAS